MTTLSELREAVKNGKTSILTIDEASKLRGKKIATIYFGYRGQDGIDEFIVGEIKRQIYPGTGKEGEICLFTEDGRNTYIFLEKNGVFSCSDADRSVYFIEV